MNQIRELLKRPYAVGIAGAVLGLLLGLLIGWKIWPVQWYDAGPANLHPEYQDMWMRMAIIDYNATGNNAAAKLEYDALKGDGPTVLANISKNPGTLQQDMITKFEVAVSAPAQVQPTSAQPGVTPTISSTTSTKTGKSNITTVLLIMCIATLVIGGIIALYFVLQNRKRATGVAPSTPDQVSDVDTSTEWANYTAPTEQAPMAQFMASYKAGDDLFDDSFSIDSPSGEFLGECGVGISETIGVGLPKKVTAFEVWLFDKNDIQTVTKVLMSAHAFNDPTIRQKLEAKGEPFEANSGGQTILETATLRLVARVVDMSYGQGALPENSFFDSLVLELAVWQK